MSNNPNAKKENGKVSSETIVAIVTPSGKGGVGIVRLSGSHSLAIAKNITRKNLEPRIVTYTGFYAENELLDKGVVLYFSAPHSYTGEEIVEFQGHGGPVILDRVLKTCCSLGARLARPGEFSERAFLNDKIDLLQAEAIADLINAETEQAAQAAIQTLEGEFSRKIHEIVNQIIDLRKFVEVALDFSDEDISFLGGDKIDFKIREMLFQMQTLLQQVNRGALLQEGFRIVLAGKPNAGKSSLLNLLSGRESAIVTPIPGTTRDVLRESVTLDGITVHLMDTAGLCESTDLVEQEGIRRAQSAIAQAYRTWYVVDASMTSLERALEEMSVLSLTTVSLIMNKVDLLGMPVHREIKQGVKVFFLSALSEDSITLLTEEVKQYADQSFHQEGQFSARRRHVVALESALTHLQQASHLSQSLQHFELLAEELKMAQKFLSNITGEFTTDDLLTEIFSSFCIGK